MHRAQADRHLPPGTYLSDASELARFGKAGSVIAGITAVLVEAADVITDLASHESVVQHSADLVGVGALAVAGYVGFDWLQQYFTQRADEVQSQ